MECANCELKQRLFFCANCLRTHLRDFRSQIQHVTPERDDQVQKASAALGFVQETRIRRATVQLGETRVQELEDGLAKLRKDNDSPSAPPSSSSSFTTAYAMLLYNVCYLAHTQSVEIPLSQAGDVLSNLWAVCCSADLGRHSHQSHPFLPPPTPPTFHLDFAQLLQATAATPTSRARTSRSKAPSVSRRSSSQTHSTNQHPRPSQKSPDKIPEEEEWDLVEDEDAL